MPNPFAKSRKVEQPYAEYAAGDFTWRILKTYKMPENEAKDPYARWFVAAMSSATYGKWEYGDTYRRDILQYGALISADDKWQETYGKMSRSLT